MDRNVYEHAECFLPWNLQHTVFNSTLFPYWTKEALYYFQQSHSGKILIRVDCQTGIKQNILYFEELTSALSAELDQEINHDELPLDQFFLQENSHDLHFSYQQYHWRYDLKNRILTQDDEINSGCLKSPNKQWSLSVKNYNLVLTDMTCDVDFQLTTDGEMYFDYASSPETNTQAITQRLENIEPSPVALWSPDSSKIITHKLDQRKVNSLFLLQNSPEKSQRPALHHYRMSFSGDVDLPLAELLIIDVETKKIIRIQTEAFISPYLTPLEFKWVWWSKNSKNIYFLREARGAKKLELCVADVDSGKSKVLIIEEAETYVEPSQIFPYSHQVIVLEDSDEIIWLSERDDYSHLYLYEIGNSVSKNAITQGQWCVRETYFYDAKRKWLYFSACGYNKNRDPYYKQLFRCYLDGSNIECLTEEDAYHSVIISPCKNYFLDTYSTICTAPVSLLKTIDGKLICCLETADLHGLAQLKWIPPERFNVKGRDGFTSIYGNLYFPSHFDPNKKYPIIDHIYPGPQVYRTPPYFSLHNLIFGSAWTAQALAELGFIVIQVDGFGTPGRSKSFHDFTYQNMSDFGIPDHVTAIEQLAEKYNFIDLNKIGITGYSAGGYAAARAMLMYPNFFKVGISAAGNHDLRCYPASYGEKYHGVDMTTYAEQSNAFHAEKLQGKLLLIHGEMDDNVHPCATMQFVNALIKHNKDFDMLIMPNQNHRSTFHHPYSIRRQWDYFVAHLLEDIPYKDYRMQSIPLKFPQIID